MNKVRKGEDGKLCDSVLFTSEGNNMFSCAIIRDGIAEEQLNASGEKKVIMFKGDTIQVDLN